MSAVPCIWVAVHDLDRTGVPVVLDRLLRWAGPRQLARFHVVARHGGALAPSVRAGAASLTVLEPGPHRRPADALAAGVAQLGATRLGAEVRAWDGRRRVRDLPSPDLVLVHGAGAVDLAAGLAPAATPRVLHLHELALAVGRSTSPTAFSHLLRTAAATLAVSTPVADLAVEAGASGDAVHLVPGVVEGPAPAVRPVDDAWVGGLGSPSWRKGVDRFAAVAATRRARHAAPTARWVGGAPSGPLALAVDADDPVRWLPPVADPWATLGAATALLVPSREDPLPLAALEAGWHGVAVVASRTGGLPALLDGGRGTTVDGHRVDHLAAALDRLLAAPDEARAEGALLHRHVRAHHHVDVVGPRWWEHLAAATG